ncbi:MAG: VaFE repeat-containing surface-anchored protein, partial [Arcanobacterium sp.]|nr:VaFE repeat-containing surface-anchored protein [Arcanobacterium sp.]
IEGKTVFTPKRANGTATVAFIVDAKLLAGKTVVAFETLTSEGKTVVIHADITDEGQTLKFAPPGQTTPPVERELPHTGSDFGGLMGASGALFGAGVAAAVVRKRAQRSN